mgnify:CR=1 FL=1
MRRRADVLLLTLAHEIEARLTERLASLEERRRGTALELLHRRVTVRPAADASPTCRRSIDVVGGESPVLSDEGRS